jgi:phosphate transport system substrate-binding protein
MKSKVYFLFILTVFLIAGCGTKTGKQGANVLSHSNQITISGAYALAPIMQFWIAEFQKTHPYVKFKLNANGTGQGLRDVVAGKVDLAMISEELPKRNDSVLWIAPVVRLGVVPVISGKNPYRKEILEKGISKEDLLDLFSGKSSKSWGELAGKSARDLVKVYMRGDTAGATATLARYLSLERKDIKGIQVKGEKELIDQVKSDPLALSYCNFIFAFDPYKKEFLEDLKVVPIVFPGKEILDGNAKIFDTYEHLQRAMWLGRYPSSLIRNLYLVSNGKPRTREIVDFIYWIITDGQRFVADNGYIELHSGEIQNLENTMKAMTQ